MTRSSTRTTAALADTHAVVTSIRRIVRVLRLASRRTHVSVGISSAQLFVLQQLGPDTHLSVNALAERTLTDRSSVAAVVDRLDEQGLVDRAIDPSDRRRAAVRITPAGRRLLAKAPEAPTTALITALRTLDALEIAKLAQSLQRLTDALGASNEPPSMLFADDGAPGQPRQTPAESRTRKR